MWYTACLNICGSIPMRHTLSCLILLCSCGAGLSGCLSPIVAHQGVSGIGVFLVSSKKHSQHATSVRIEGIGALVSHGRLGIGFVRTIQTEVPLSESGTFVSTSDAAICTGAVAESFAGMSPVMDWLTDSYSAAAVRLAQGPGRLFRLLGSFLFQPVGDAS